MHWIVQENVFPLCKEKKVLLETHNGRVFQKKIKRDVDRQSSMVSKIPYHSAFECIVFFLLYEYFYVILWHFYVSFILHMPDINDVIKCHHMWLGIPVHTV